MRVADFSSTFVVAEISAGDGAFKESEVCTRLPSDPFALTCITQSRNDQGTPQVLERVQYAKDCSGYTKIVRGISFLLGGVVLLE